MFSRKTNETAAANRFKNDPQAAAHVALTRSRPHASRTVSPYPRAQNHRVSSTRLTLNFQEKARQAKFSGNVQVGLKVDTAGHPQDIWITRAAGMDLDAKAGEAVSEYKFAPATCRGNPIPVELYIDVNADFLGPSGIKFIDATPNAWVFR